MFAEPVIGVFFKSPAADIISHGRWVMRIFSSLSSAHFSYCHEIGA